MCGDRSRALGRLVFLAIVYTTFRLEAASAQPTQAGCTSAPGPSAAQTLRCRDGLIIVAEDGATFTLQGRNGNVNAVDLQSKALLVDAPKQPGKSHFRVTTPQAIAAVRGTKSMSGKVGRRCWCCRAVSACAGPPAPRTGEGVDVDPGTEPLVIKRWPQPRVDALLARLGQ